MKKSNFFVLLAIVMMAFTQSVWAVDPHFNLIGHFTPAMPNNGPSAWHEQNTAKPLNKTYNNEPSKFYIEVDIEEGKTYNFAFNNHQNNSGGDRYAPITGEATDGSGEGKNKVLDVTALATVGGKVTAAEGNKTDACYNAEITEKENVRNNSWKFTANYTGKLIIGVDESVSEWYPAVWLERPGVSKTFYLIGDAISHLSNDYWGATNKACPLDHKKADGKYYVNLYLKNGSSFALSNGEKRFAPATSPVSVVLNTVKDTIYGGSFENGQDNSWKYEGETGLVRLVLNVNDSTFTLEPWQLHLIGSPAQVQGEGDNEIGTWDVKNTSTPVVTPYVNAEGTPEEGKFYSEVLLNKDNSYFAFSDGVLRYANDTQEENKDINCSDTVQGTYNQPENSWKYVGESGYVLVCVDYTAAPQPIIWLEKSDSVVEPEEFVYPEEIYPIGTACAWGWTIENAVAIARLDDSTQVVYTDTLTLQAGELKFLCQRDWGKHFGPTVKDAPMEVVGEYGVELVAEGDHKWKNTLVGDYIVTLNAETLMLTLEAIETPENPDEAIREAVETEACRKVLRNGQVLILRGDKAYNLLGVTL